jgi:hypothetical protein
MRLGARIRGLERSAQRAGATGTCAACGLPRVGGVAGGVAYRGATIAAIGPRVVKHITEIESEAGGDPEQPCAGCGRVRGVLVLRIPPPVPARLAAGREAA